MYVLSVLQVYVMATTVGAIIVRHGAKILTDQRLGFISKLLIISARFIGKVCKIFALIWKILATLLKYFLTV